MIGGGRTKTPRKTGAFLYQQALPSSYSNPCAFGMSWVGRICGAGLASTVGAAAGAAIAPVVCGSAGLAGTAAADCWAGGAAAG